MCSRLDGLSLGSSHDQRLAPDVLGEMTTSRLPLSFIIVVVVVVVVVVFVISPLQSRNLVVLPGYLLL